MQEDMICAESEVEKEGEKMGILASVIKRECYDSDKMSNTP